MKKEEGKQNLFEKCSDKIILIQKSIRNFLSMKPIIKLQSEANKLKQD